MSQETSPGLPREWIRRIFNKFEGFYGSAYMASIWGSEIDKLENTFQVWSEELKNFKYSPESIKRVLDNLPKAPPNCYEFKELCREALKNMPKPLAIEEKMTPEQLAKNKLRVKELLRTLAREKSM